MQSRSWVLLGFLAILFLGCVSNPSPPSTPAPAPSGTVTPAPAEDLDEYINALPLPEPGPGDVLKVCGTGEEAEECFEEVLESCGRASASFWSTSDGQVLDFESSGLDIASLGEGLERCKVRVYVSADSESAFAGTSASCLLEKNAAGIYDVYAVGPDRCAGTYVDEILRTAATPAAVQPSTAARVITLTASDDGFSDASNASVTQVTAQAGEKIKFVFISSTTNNSFGGQGIKSVGQSLFNYPHIAPGAQQATDEITVTQNFTVQNWWPNFQVKKGEFQVVVTP